MTGELMGSRVNKKNEKNKAHFGVLGKKNKVSRLHGVLLEAYFHFFEGAGRAEFRAGNEAGGAAPRAPPGRVVDPVCVPHNDTAVRSKLAYV